MEIYQGASSGPHHCHQHGRGLKADVWSTGLEMEPGAANSSASISCWAPGGEREAQAGLRGPGAGEGMVLRSQQLGLGLSCPKYMLHGTLVAPGLAAG